MRAANARIAELSRQNSQLVSDLHKAGARVDAAKDALEAHEKRELEEHRRRTTSLASDLAAANSRIAELEQRADISPAQLELGQRLIAGLTAERDAANARISAVKTALPTEFHYNGRLQPAPAWFKRALKALEGVVIDDHLEYHRKEDPHALEAALRRCTDLESQCRSLSEDRVAANARIAELEASNEAGWTIARERGNVLKDNTFRADQAERAATSANAQADLFAERAKNLEQQWRGANARADAAELEKGEAEERFVELLRVAHNERNAAELNVKKAEKERDDIHLQMAETLENFTGLVRYGQDFLEMNPMKDGVWLYYPSVYEIMSALWLKKDHS